MHSATMAPKKECAVINYYASLNLNRPNNDACLKLLSSFVRAVINITCSLLKNVDITLGMRLEQPASKSCFGHRPSHIKPL